MSKGICTRSDDTRLVIGEVKSTSNGDATLFPATSSSSVPTVRRYVPEARRFWHEPPEGFRIGDGNAPRDRVIFRILNGDQPFDQRSV